MMTESKNLDDAKRSYEELLKAEEKADLLKRQGLAPTERFEDDNVVVGPHGAFKKAPAVELANDPGKPQIFKLTLNHITQVVWVSNKERSWSGSFHVSTMPGIMELFHTGNIVYVIGQANASGKLHIEHVIALRDEHKF